MGIKTDSLVDHQLETLSLHVEELSVGAIVCGEHLLQVPETQEDTAVR